MTDKPLERPMSAEELRALGNPITAVFYREREGSVSELPSLRRYQMTLTGPKLTIDEIKNNFTNFYNSAILHDPLNGCLILDLDNGVMGQMPCRKHFPND